MTRTYLRENLDPLRDRVKLLDAPAPWPAGHRPDKSEPPGISLAERKLEILPGVSVFRVPGHTWGQQAVCFADERGQTVVFVPDLIPTIHHAGAAYNMAYDVEPYISSVTRRWFLEEAARGDWLLVLDHEPGNPCCRVKEDGKGWFKLERDEVFSENAGHSRACSPPSLTLG
jgi:glyoxylase-like metal-dependent hydrolase (beta-lactamase superfamily II)